MHIIEYEYEIKNEWKLELPLIVIFTCPPEGVDNLQISLLV